MELITISAASKRFGIPYSTLAEAARFGRLTHWRRGGRLFTTPSAVRAAIKAGKLRAPKQLTNTKE